MRCRLSGYELTCLGPESFTLLVAGNFQRRVAFLPWARARLKASKPKDWTDKPVTLGDHLKKARKERRLLQREVAKALGVDSMSLVNWEKNRTRIGARFVPAIIQWLGYDPLPTPNSIGEWIAVERTRRGLARRTLAAALGWDEATLLGWDEATLSEYEGGRPPDTRRLAQLRAVLGKPSSETLQGESHDTVPAANSPRIAHHQATWQV